MIDYSKITLSVFDYAGNKVGVVYTPDTKRVGQAHDIMLTHESNGWKELAFSIPQQVEGMPNPLVEGLVNEYLIHVDDGNYKDVFIISEPSLVHNNALKTIDVNCNHLSSRLRMKKLYLTFDDTNGIGKCNELVEIILQGTGWSIGTIDKFYEPDGATEKVRTLASSGKEGAYQLIGKVCDLFNARPVFHGDTKKVDIVAFAPYKFEHDEENPTLTQPESLIELNYSKAMSGITRKLNTENLITRLYVEGEFGDNGYLGIETVNPSGTNFVLNFDYFKAIGLFTSEHQGYVDNYLAMLGSYRQEIKAYSLLMSERETQLMDLWGTADYSVYDVMDRVDDFNLDVVHITSLGDNRVISSGNVAVILFSDNSQLRTTVTMVSGSRITLEDRLLDGVNINAVLIYRTPASGSIGGKEAAVEAAEETYKEIAERFGDNLVKDSDVAVSTSTPLVRNYTLTENWDVGKKYTVTVWGTVNTGNVFRAYRDNGTTLVADLTYDTSKRCWMATFECPAGIAGANNILAIYSTPSATATNSSIQRVKLEFGEVGTPWSPANNSSNQELLEEYAQRITDLYNGNEHIKGIYELTREAVLIARGLEVSREGFRTALTNLNHTEETFADNMGDLLRDGYWQDTSYVVGQEESLFNDAIKTHEVMSKPVADYQIQVYNMVGADAAPHMNVSINSAVHIIDEEVAINAWGYVDQVVYSLDAPYKNSLRVSTHEARFAGQSFTQMISQIAETARDVRDKKDIFARAGLITKDGELPTKALQGIINTEATRLLSKTSNWETDERGNLVFTSQDGGSAMMLTGEGFMIANGRTPEGKWDWRTFGTGRGFTADEINAGTLQAGIVKILGTDQFFWDADNIYIFDPLDPRRQIRMGRYDGVNYGIGFTQDDGATWVSAFGFDGVNLNYATFDVSQVSGIGDIYLSHGEAGETYETITNVGAINSTLQDLSHDIRQNIQFTAGGIIIQKQDSAGGFSSRFTSTALEFYEGADRIAWFENRALNVDNIIAKRQFSIGNLVWYVNGDGSVAAKWYG